MSHLIGRLCVFIGLGILLLRSVSMLLLDEDVIARLIGAVVSVIGVLGMLWLFQC